jgi:hypothetical protein
MGDNSENKEGRAQKASDVARMKRAASGLERLADKVERGEMNADQALRGMLLFLESLLKPAAAAEAQRQLDQMILSAEERAELLRLRTRVAEFKELLEAERVAGESKAEVKSAEKPGRKCPSVAPSANTGDPVEDWRLEIVNFFLREKFNAGTPRPKITAEELKAGRVPKVGRELIYRPSGLLVPTDKLMAAFGLNGHFVLRPEEQSRIGFSPAEEGYWFWAEASESALRRGGSFEKFEREAPEGWTIMSLEEYFLARLVMENFCGVTMDVDEPVCLRTTYATKGGESMVLYVQSHVGREGVELIVRSISPKAVVPNLGTRYRKLVPSARLKD